MTAQQNQDRLQSINAELLALCQSLLADGEGAADHFAYGPTTNTDAARAAISRATVGE